MAVRKMLCTRNGPVSLKAGRDLVHQQSLLRSAARICNPLHEFPSAKDNEQVGTDSSYDRLGGGQRAGLWDPSAKLERRVGEVEPLPCRGDEGVKRPRARCPSGKGRHC
jgi:hypothetical protein